MTLHFLHYHVELPRYFTKSCLPRHAVNSTATLASPHPLEKALSFFNAAAKRLDNALSSRYMSQADYSIIRKKIAKCRKTEPCARCPCYCKLRRVHQYGVQVKTTTGFFAYSEGATRLFLALRYSSSIRLLSCRILSKSCLALLETVSMLV